MCGIYCVYKQSRSCQLPFCASPIFHFEIGDFSVYLLVYTSTHSSLTPYILLESFQNYCYTLFFNTSILAGTLGKKSSRYQYHPLRFLEEMC